MADTTNTTTNTNTGLNDFDPKDTAYPPLSEEACLTLGIIRAAEAAELSHDLTPYILDINAHIRANVGWGDKGLTWYPPRVPGTPFTISREALSSICYTLHLLGYKTEYCYPSQTDAGGSASGSGPSPIGITIYW